MCRDITVLKKKKKKKNPAVTKKVPRGSNYMINQCHRQELISGKYAQENHCVICKIKLISTHGFGWMPFHLIIITEQIG